jgi:hypothetical protein
MATGTLYLNLTIEGLSDHPRNRVKIKSLRTHLSHYTRRATEDIQKIGFGNQFGFEIKSFNRTLVLTHQGCGGENS